MADIAAETSPNVGVGTMNNAIQKAAGTNKDIFTCVVMHSVVATNLENLQLLEYVKYNDGSGMERSLRTSAAPSTRQRTSKSS